MRSAPSWGLNSVILEFHESDHRINRGMPSMSRGLLNHPSHEREVKDHSKCCKQRSACTKSSGECAILRQGTEEGT
jgi:hypothetical protein